MKAAYFVNVLLSAALLLLCIELRAEKNASRALAKPVASEAAVGTGRPQGTAQGETVVDSSALDVRVSGFGGPVPVEVRVRDGIVERVSPKLPNDETPAFFGRLEQEGLWNAWNGLPVEVAATARVDAVTGATYSSTAAIANVRAVLESVSGSTPAISPAQNGDEIRLPPPVKDRMALGEALLSRRTDRDFSSEPLSPQELSDLLWAANGYNRPEEKKRTAPTAINRQEIDIYVCRADGAYLWKSGENSLVKVCDADLRGLTGRMKAGADNFALKAPVALVYVIDYERQGMQARPDDAKKYASVDCGFVGQNVYLHCAAAGLKTVFLGSLSSGEIAAALKLQPTSTPLFAQTVGK